MISSGYENPKFITPIVKNYYTKIKPSKLIDQNFPTDKSWENVEYVKIIYKI